MRCWKEGKSECLTEWVWGISSGSHPVSRRSTMFLTMYEKQCEGRWIDRRCRKRSWAESEGANGSEWWKEERRRLTDLGCGWCDPVFYLTRWWIGRKDSRHEYTIYDWRLPKAAWSIQRIEPVTLVRWTRVHLDSPGGEKNIGERELVTEKRSAVPFHRSHFSRMNRTSLCNAFPVCKSRFDKLLNERST